MSRQYGSLPEFVAVATVVVLLPTATRSLTLATEVLVFGLVVVASNLLLGKAGLLSFGQAVFFGLGGYLGAHVLKLTPAGLVGAAVVCAAAGAFVAAAIGMLAIRRQGIYFVMLTLTFCQLAYFIAYTASGITGGENGLLDVPRTVLPAGLLGDILARGVPFYASVAVVFLAVGALVIRMDRSPFGSVLLAIRENPVRAAVIGYNVRAYKIGVFAVSGAITALAGALHASLLGFVPLTNVSIEMSERILIMTILAGSGGMLSALLAALVVLVLNDWFAALWPRWMLLLGLSLIVIALFAPNGIGGLLSPLRDRLRAALGIQP